MPQLSVLVFMMLQTAGVIWAEACVERPVPGTEGGEVTLQLGHTDSGDTFISWTLLPSAGPVATTRPEGHIDYVSKRYAGRVGSTTDGSLHITYLTLDDQSIYKATIQTDGGQKCLHYNLTVHRNLSAGDIQISHNVTSRDPCSVALMCTVTVRDVTVTWGSVDRSDINVTGDVLYVPPRDVNVTYSCTASNPISHASKTVVPQRYCRPGSHHGSIENVRHHLIIAGCIIVIIVIIIIIVAGCLLRRKKRMKRKEIATIATTYVQVGEIPRPVENHYDSSEKRGEISGTSTSEVKAVQQRKPQIQEDRKRNVQPAPETVYALVRNVTETTTRSVTEICYNHNGTSAEKDVTSLYSTVTHPMVLK